MISAQHGMPQDAPEPAEDTGKGLVHFGQQHDGRRREPPMQCSGCGGNIRRSRLRTFVSYALSCLSIYPYRCEKCLKRHHRIKWEQAVVMATVALTLTCAIGAVGMRDRFRFMGAQRTLDAQDTGGTRSQPIANVLSNQDVIALSQVSLRTDVITRLIRTSPHNFTVDPVSLISLKEAGAPDDVIAAIVEVTPSYRRTGPGSTRPQQYPPNGVTPFAVAPTPKLGDAYQSTTVPVSVQRNMPSPSILNVSSPAFSWGSSLVSPTSQQETRRRSELPNGADYFGRP